MDLAIQIVVLATAVVGLAKAIVEAMHAYWAKRPKRKRSRRK